MAGGRQRLTLSRAKDCPVRKKVNLYADRSEGSHPHRQGARKEVILLGEKRPVKPRDNGPYFRPIAFVTCVWRKSLHTSIDVLGHTRCLDIARDKTTNKNP